MGGHTKAEARKIVAETKAEVKAEIVAKITADTAKMTPLEVSAALTEEYVKPEIRKDPNILIDARRPKTRDIRETVFYYACDLIDDDAATKATFDALLNQGSSKNSAELDIFYALLGRVFEVAMGDPDRWPTVLELLRNGVPESSRPLQPIRKDLVIRFRRQRLAREAIMAAKEISVKKYVVRLSGEERERLETLIRKG